MLQQGQRPPWKVLPLVREIKHENLPRESPSSKKSWPAAAPLLSTATINPNGFDRLKQGKTKWSQEESRQAQISLHFDLQLLMIWFKGDHGPEVRTTNDRNICERRSCMKNNGKSPTFKFVSGEERRPSEVQRISRGWRLPGATHSSADPTWIRKWLGLQAPELPELKSVEIELGSCCFDLDNKVSDKICRARKKQFEIPFRL